MHKGLQRAAQRDRKRQKKRKMGVSGRSIFTCLNAQVAREAQLVAGKQKGKSKQSKGKGKAR